MWKNRRLKMSCWKNENNLEKRINKFMEYSVNYSRLTPYECQSRELHKITEKVSYLLRSLVLKPLFFLASPRQPLLDKTCVYTATFICILYLKRTTIQNSEYFTRLLFTSLNSIYSVANVLNILYTKTSKIANFSATFSMLVLFISRLKPRVF